MQNVISESERREKNFSVLVGSISCIEFLHVLYLQHQTRNCQDMKEPLRLERDLVC